MCVLGSSDQEKRPCNYMKNVERQRCSDVGLFCAGDRATEGLEAKSSLGYNNL